VSPFMLGSRNRVFRRRPSGFSRRRRRFEWSAISLAAGAMSAANGFASQVQMRDNAFISEMTEPTLKRIRGQLLVQGNQAVGSTGAFSGSVAFGIQVVSKVVTTEFELPFTDAQSGNWLWWNIVPLFAIPNLATGETATNFNAPTTQSVRLEIDARAQRKVDENSQIVFVAECIQPLATFTWEEVDFAFGARMLFEQV